MVPPHRKINLLNPDDFPRSGKFNAQHPDNITPGQEVMRIKAKNISQQEKSIPQRLKIIPQRPANIFPSH
ncbi:MAG: hypothetical protein HY301_10350 [Verrucomicrobia bacterium]|nr:hypothetical protein [Verrucomicrobiota bacterium]